MRGKALGVCALLVIAGNAAGQTTMYAIDWPGNFLEIDRTTGAATLIGPTGFTGTNGAAADSQGRIFTHSSTSDELIIIDPTTGAGSIHLTLTGRPTGYGIRGMAFDPQDQLYVVLSQVSTLTVDPLARIDMNTGEYTIIGETGRTDVQGLACDGAGVLYAAGATGNLYILNGVTASATLVSTGTLGTDGQALDFDADGTLYATRSSLRTIDPVTGATITILGATGFDIRGTAIVGLGDICYANCDGSTTPPVLNVDDFTCFINEFAAAQSLPHAQQVTHYANCDGSQTAPVLNVDDFTCFINQFAAGCR